MRSVRRLIVFWDFQFVRMVFLAIAGLISVGFMYFGGSSTENKSPIIHNEGARGMLQPKIEEIFCVTLNQKSCSGGQIHKEWRKSSVVPRVQCEHVSVLERSFVLSGVGYMENFILD